MKNILLILSLIFTVFSCSHGTKKNLRETHVQAKSAELMTYVYGSGSQTLILVHGGPALPGYMGTLGELLQDRYRIVEYLQRDAAASKSKGPFTIAAKAEDLEAVVERFSENGPPVVVAHSGGSLAALEFAKSNSRKMRKLILVGASGLEKKTDKEYDQNLTTRLQKLIPDWEKKLNEASASYKAAKAPDERHARYHEMLDFYWPAYFPNGKKPASLKFARANLDASRETETDYGKSIKQGLFKRGLGRISVSVTHLHGKLDPLPWERTASTFKRRLKNYRLVLIENAGHFPWLDAPEVKDGFLKKLEKAIDSSP